MLHFLHCKELEVDLTQENVTAGALFQRLVLVTVAYIPLQFPPYQALHEAVFQISFLPPHLVLQLPSPTLLAAFGTPPPAPFVVGTQSESSVQVPSKVLLVCCQLVEIRSEVVPL